LFSWKFTPMVPSKSFQSAMTFSPMMMLKSSRDEYWTTKGMGVYVAELDGRVFSPFIFVQIKFSVGCKILMRTELFPTTSEMIKKNLLNCQKPWNKFTNRWRMKTACLVFWDFSIQWSSFLRS
jgi:hypothetical protein